MTHLALWRFGLARAETQTSDAERAALGRHAAGKNTLVEVGVWHGVTTCVLRRAMAESGVLYAVDPYPAGSLGFSAQRVIAHAEVARVRRGAVEWVEATGIEAARRHREAKRALVDFMFIDGDHSYEGIRGDWEAWSDLVAPAGIVALHDSRSSDARRIDDAGSAVYTRTVILADQRYRPIDAVDTLTVVRRQ
jgi:predicted O-methyltransferase YrrM